MNNEFSPDLVSLLTDDGKEIEFEILDTVDYGESTYYVLSHHFDNPSDALNRAFEYYIFEVVNDDGEEKLIEVEDEHTAQEVYKIFEERYNNLLFENCE
ncbi:DUF1292 domain-containing protein [Ruminococcus sp. YE282]|jgi:uncharacterized protein YrzB (UPF0473 family)|uniref:DUF1292 domain-containing protein n=1 Tax=Ruminococcus sp. YE282 TaxID=3158780 RepID=UPI0008874EF1|nr:DUF1292 domain-containing protein [Ruminococcus bromii]MEE3498233.1 DUF1292 domain-containing protein [Ruminococcus bromii]SCY39586.1 Protein of unknown function [Ruminococcus bromii]